MSTVSIVLIVVLVVVLVALGVLAFWGNKQQKKAESAQQQIEAAAQPMTMLVIDKKKMKLTESGLPKIVIDSTPKLMRRTKVPVVKAKVGPRIMTLIADDKIYDLIPVKQEIKAMVSGMYILSVKSLRGPALTAPPKVGFFQRMKNKVSGK
ncbi:hypothetical protein [Frisingicoccus sp.]|uniref:hypothetical protein n=1 Tax=Frisingicoccus sp. TaxID=1918627 RepID=UPI0015C11E64|nr:hypothetical protein [Frisingicoccus sp.]MEE0751510.1 hypothetical protein [Frisingicoccus sp.]